MTKKQMIGRLLKGSLNSGIYIKRLIMKKIDNVLHDHGIDISDCRGQGYDNGANMSGKSKGVQAQILKNMYMLIHHQ